jgi:hypothetical protein
MNDPFFLRRVTWYKAVIPAILWTLLVCLAYWQITDFYFWRPKLYMSDAEMYYRAGQGIRRGQDF